MRESASFSPNVDALEIVSCHTRVLIKKQCPFLKHNSVSLHFISTGKMPETPGVQQMALLSVKQSFAVFHDPYKCSSYAPLLRQHYRFP